MNITPITTIMKNGMPETVHVILLGEEAERAIQPFKENVVSRVCLITGAGDSPEIDGTEQVISFLKKKHIPVKKIKPASTEMQELIKTTAAVIRTEIENGNKVYVNMSAAGKKAAAVATLVGMALGADVYYVPISHYSKDAQRENNGISICSSEDVQILPKVNIVLPDEEETSILQELYDAEEESLSASDIGSLLEKTDELENKILCEINENTPDFYETRKIQSRNLMRVSSLMKKLEEKGYVEKGKTGRKMMYTITEQGKYILYLSGTLF